MMIWAHDHDYNVSKTILVAHIYIQALLHSSSYFTSFFQGNCPSVKQLLLILVQSSSVFSSKG